MKEKPKNSIYKDWQKADSDVTMDTGKRVPSKGKDQKQPKPITIT